MFYLLLTGGVENLDPALYLIEAAPRRRRDQNRVDALDSFYLIRRRCAFDQAKNLVEFGRNLCCTRIAQRIKGDALISKRVGVDNREQFVNAP